MLCTSSSPGLSKSNDIWSFSNLRHVSNTFPAFEVKPVTFFLVFPVVNSSVRISSESSTFATVCQTLKPHSHSYFHCDFLRGLPHFGQSTLVSIGLGFSGKSKAISPSSVSFNGASNFMPVFETNPDITSVFFFVRSSLRTDSFILTLATLPTIKRQLSGSSRLLFSHTKPNGATWILPPHFGHTTSFTVFGSTWSKSNWTESFLFSSSLSTRHASKRFPLFDLKPRMVSVFLSLRSCFRFAAVIVFPAICPTEKRQLPGSSPL